MTSFTNLVETLEKLAFEILLWIIFIPKTLFKIIWNPSWVPEYVDEELAKDKGRFSEYVSPLILFIIIVIGMIGAIQGVFSLSGVETVVPPIATVGEETVFYAKPKFIWSDHFAFSQWAIINEDGETDVFTRYNFDLLNTNNPIVVKFNKFTEERVPAESKGNISREEYFSPFSDTELISANDRTSYISPASKLTYQWKKEGTYTVFVAFYGNSGGFLFSNMYRVYVSKSGLSPQVPPFTENEISLIESVFGDEITSTVNLSVFQSRENSAILVLLALMIPMVMALFSHLLQEGNLSRASLQRHFYIHILYSSPVILSGLTCVFFIVSAFELIIGGRWESDNSEYILRWLSGFWLIFLVSTIWFVVCETKFFIREVKKDTKIFISLAAVVWLVIRFHDYQLPFRVFLYTDFSYYFYVIPLSIYFRIVPVDFTLAIPDSLVGLSSNSKGITLVLSLIIAMVVIPPLGYIANRFLPAFWRNFLKLLDDRRRKGDYLQRVKRLISKSKDIIKTTGLIALGFVAVFWVIGLIVVGTLDATILQESYIVYLQIIGASLLSGIGYLIIHYVNAIIMCCIFAIFEKPSTALAIFSSITIGILAISLLDYFLGGEYSEYIIVSPVIVVPMAYFGWKIKNISQEENTLKAKE